MCMGGSCCLLLVCSTELADFLDSGSVLLGGDVQDFDALWRGGVLCVRLLLGDTLISTTSGWAVA